MGVQSATSIKSALGLNDPSVLMSGLRIENLRLPAGIEVQRTDGPCGTILRGIDLADDLPAEVISLILTLFHHSGVLVIPGQNRLTPQRQMEVTEWFGRPYNREGAGKFDDIPTVDGRAYRTYRAVPSWLLTAMFRTIRFHPMSPCCMGWSRRRRRRVGTRCSPICFKPMTNSTTR